MATRPAEPGAASPVSELRLFAVGTTRRLGERIATLLERELDEHEERSFEDGEHKTRPLVPVRDRDVYVTHSLYSEPGESVNDKLCRLLFFLGALRDAGAARLTVVAPYLCYARKDRRTKNRDPVTTKYVAQVIEAVGADRVVTLDVHDLAAFENAFRIPTDNLGALPLFLDPLIAELPDDGRLTVLSPDAGGAKRAEACRQVLAEALGREVGSVYAAKFRSRGEVTGEAVVGEVEGRTVIAVDDLVSTGTTLVRAARACREKGAERVIALATHGLFSAGVEGRLADPALEWLMVTDTVERATAEAREASRGKIRVVECAPMLAEAIRRLHAGDSLTDLSGPEWMPGRRVSASSR